MLLMGTLQESWYFEGIFSSLLMQQLAGRKPEIESKEPLQSLAKERALRGLSMLASQEIGLQSSSLGY